MKLSEVVRGVEENPIFNNVYEEEERYGYDALASAEVVVDREAIELVIRNVYVNVMTETKRDKNVMDARALEMAKQVIEAIATAIESGDVISIKQEG